MRFHPRLLIASTVLLLAGLACNLFTLTPPPALTPAALPTSAPPPTAAAPPVTASEEQLLIDLYQRVNPSVVAILVEDQTGGALGTGFVIDTEGHVVTNFHVVEGAQQIEVDFPSGFKTRGQVLGTDADSDLAVIKMDTLPEQLIPVPLGDSDQVQVGQRVVAIGNPFGLSGTMTIGIVSGLGRTLQSVRTTESGAFSAPDIIQTDAAINRGNSGGPLLNLQGEVIGVNKALESETGFNAGIGFAVASNTVKQVVPYLIKDGKFVYPYLGIRALDELSLSAQERLKLPQASGAYVTSVVPGGPSDQAGLQADSASETAADFNGDGDLIIAIDGRAVRVFSNLLSYLVNHTRPGQAVTLTVLRGGEKVDVKVTLGERP
ncbi:MAG: putative S1B family peptidase [Anaerolineales bacterium]|nr:putative S1B family peptidase [Anaerolineales bacterium]